MRIDYSNADHRRLAEKRVAEVISLAIDLYSGIMKECENHWPGSKLTYGFSFGGYLTAAYPSIVVICSGEIRFPCGTVGPFSFGIGSNILAVRDDSDPAPEEENEGFRKCTMNDREMIVQVMQKVLSQKYKLNHKAELN